MTFKISHQDDPFLEKILTESLADLNAFFELYWVHHLPRIIVVDDRATINALKGEKTEPWVVGWSEVKNIYVLDRDSFEKESDHAYSEKEYAALIKHELAHSFFNALSGGTYKPIWLNEGIAIYTSGQNAYKKRPERFGVFLNYFDKGGKDLYAEAGFFVQMLVEKHGKQKLLDIVKNLKNIKTPEDLSFAFETAFGFPLSYRAIDAALLASKRC